MSVSQIRTSTIMFTDMVGYSKMAAKDEKSALALLDEHNQIIFPVVEQFNGKVIKLIGDAVFADFQSPLDSIQSAIDIQTQFRDRNKICRIDDQIRIRIGLHLGEVIERDNDLFGHEVNLGSRIENSTPSECISVSEEVFLAIAKEKDIFCRKIGHVKLKNIPEPKLLYKIYLDLLDYNNESDGNLQDSFTQRGIEIVDIEDYNVQDIISFAMLYLTNLGSEKEEYLSHNITESILSDLGGIKQLRTPGFTEVIRYKKSELPISEIARRMQVHRLAQGTLLVKDNNIIINLEMIDIDRGVIIWNKKWETHTSKLIQLQNQMLSHILEKLGVDIPNQIKKQFSLCPTENSEAYDEYQKARYIMATLKKNEDIIKAKKLLENAVTMDPNFMWAQAQIGHANLKLGYYEKAEEQLYFALDIAKQDGTSLSNAYVYNQLGFLYNQWGKYKKALKYISMALEIQKQMDMPIVRSTYLHNLANSYKNLGDTKAALKYYDESLKIKQKYEKRDLQPHTYAMIGNVYLATGEYTKAITPLRSSLSIFREIGNAINEGLVLLNMTELFINIGQFDKAEKFISDAEVVLLEFKDPEILGYLNYYKGNIAFQKLEIVKAIEHIGNSIEQFQIAQKLQKAYHRYLLLVHILIYDQQYHEADINLNKINPLEKQVRDEKDVLLADCLRLFIRAIQNDLSPSRGEKILKNLQGSKHNNDCHFSWWYLALSFSIIGENKKSKRCLKESKKILSRKVAIITNESHRDGFINNNILHHQIMNLNDKTLKDLTDSFKIQSSSVKMSKFCSECGYANIDMLLSCPECDYDLQMD